MNQTRRRISPLNDVRQIVFLLNCCMNTAAAVWKKIWRGKKCFVFFAKRFNRSPYAEAKATLDACGISRQALTEEKADIYEQLAQLNKQIRAERQKIKLCREIADSAAVMQRDVTAQEKSLHEKETEHSFTNRR